jgi:uncharacterized protein YceK
MISLLCLLLAGCSSTANRNDSGNPHAGSSTPTTYHHETVSEFSDGETKFLQLVPDKNP